MQREIKFRAWDVNRLRWLTQEEIESYNFSKDVSVYRGVRWCQFTGLKDKNGVEIFESDLVDWAGDVYEVRFNEGEWQLFNSGDMEGDRPSLYRISSPKQSRMVIVGNIYENKKR